MLLSILPKVFLQKTSPNYYWNISVHGVDDHVSLNDGFESEGQSDGSEFQDTTDSGKKKETKAFTFYFMETEEVSERYISPCFTIRKRWGKVVKKELLVSLKGDLYFLKFIINPEQDDGVPGVVLGWPFLRLAKGIINFRNRIITIYPDLDSFNDDFNDNWEAILDRVDVSDLPLIDVIDIPTFVCNMGKSSRNKKRPKPRPIIETLKFNDQHKKLPDSVLLVKLKLDEEVELEKASTEEVIRSYKAIKEKNNQRVFVLPIRIEEKFDFHALAYTDIPVDRDVPIVVVRSFLYTCGNILSTIKRTTSIFDGFCHQKFYVSKVRNNHGESDSDDEEEYYLKRDEMENLSMDQTVQKIEAMLEIKVYKMGGEEEIFIFEAWRQAFDINERIHTELCHEFYSAYDYYEVVTDDELMTKKLIKFREFTRHPDMMGSYSSMIKSSVEMTQVGFGDHSDEQVLLAEDQAWMESSSDSDQKINTNMVFMAQIEKVLSK
nr:hypothetical protein [Tanacetum cinerariifolium]